MTIKTQTGLDRLLRGNKAAWPKALAGAKVGLLCHPSSVDRDYRHVIDVVGALECVKLTTLFGPQHGLLGNTQDNMIEWEGGKGRGKAALPTHSLYGKRREPTPAMLKNIDALIIDMQDVGAKYYTFIWTMALCLKACEKLGKAVVILDRPNPINGVDVEGPVTDPDYTSFVGLYPLPIRHGMTIGEVAGYLQGEYFPDVDLHVIKMTGWSRKMYFEDTGLPWVLPSPNMPTMDAAVVYPGGCLLEATNLSEGRGTTRPFEFVGAPYINSERWLKRLNSFKLPGVIFRAHAFEPTFQKHAKKICYGVQIHVTNRKTFKSLLTTTAMFKAALEQNPKDFKWNSPPYEYELKKLPVDILAGCDTYRLMLERGDSLAKIETWWKADSRKFMALRRKYLLYRG